MNINGEERYNINYNMCKKIPRICHKTRYVIIHQVTKYIMDEKIILAIGITASTCSAICLLPQLIKISKEKKAEAISIPMLAILLLGLGLWVVYGVFKRDAVIIIANAVSIFLNLLTMFFSLRYKSK